MHREFGLTPNSVLTVLARLPKQKRENQDAPEFVFHPRSISISYEVSIC